MDDFVEYMKEVDPDSSLVCKENFNDNNLTKDYYLQYWKQILMNNAGKEINKSGSSKFETILRKKSLDDDKSAMYPYDP